jgi:hypothetical protein
LQKLLRVAPSSAHTEVSDQLYRNWTTSREGYEIQLHADYSKYLRSIPATVSECNAHFALEPQQLAKLGLADASKALELQPEATEAHTQSAWAHLLLENYSTAEAVARTALSLEANDLGAKVRFAMAHTLLLNVTLCAGEVA